MHVEVITRREDFLIRRLVLEPDEAMPWHTDACRHEVVIFFLDPLGIEPQPPSP